MYPYKLKLMPDVNFLVTKGEKPTLISVLNILCESIKYSLREFRCTSFRFRSDYILKILSYNCYVKYVYIYIFICIYIYIYIYIYNETGATDTDRNTEIWINFICKQKKKVLCFDIMCIYI